MSAAAEGGPSMLFVVGASRSGTTMMGRVLGGHPLVHTFDELHFFEQLVEAEHANESRPRAELERLARLLCSSVHEGYHRRVADRHDAEAAALVEAIDGEPTPAGLFAAFMRRHAPASPIGCDQTPRNLYAVEPLLALYPGSRFVVLVRDPRDVLLSQKNRWKRRRHGGGSPRRNTLRTWAQYHPAVMSRLWRSAAARAAGYLDDAPTADPRVAVVRFESLVADPVGVVRGLCERFGLAFDEATRAAMLDVPRVGSSVAADRPGQRGIDPSVVGRWRQGLTRREVACCEAVCASPMAAFGYEPSGAALGVADRLMLTVTLAAKLPIGVLTNIGRLGRIFPFLWARMG